MKAYEKVILIICIAIFVLTYIISNITFEMSTNEFSLHDKIAMYIITVIPVAYYSFVYIGPKKLQAYTTILIGSALLWVGVLYVVNKTSLLCSLASQSPATANLRITDVRKYKVKNSFDGSRIFVEYDNHTIEFRSSRINYFAFLHHRNFKADIGKSGTDNYYISKIYWEPGEFARARSMYWRDWRHRMRFIPFIVLGVVTFIPIVLYFKRKQEAHRAAPTKWSGVAIYLKIMGLIFGLFMLTYFILLGYLYFRYGHIG